ncbi:hypothetical protein [Mesotoga sp.]
MRVCEQPFSFLEDRHPVNRDSLSIFPPKTVLPENGGQLTVNVVS